MLTAKEANTLAWGSHPFTPIFVILDTVESEAKMGRFRLSLDKYKIRLSSFAKEKLRELGYNFEFSNSQTWIKWE